MIGIYALMSIRDGKVWIGQSLDIERRIQNHFGELRRGINSPHLQNAWNKCPFFGWAVVELCSPDQLNTRENFWIEKMGSWSRDRGYNLERFASGTGPQSEETIRKKSLCMKGRPSPKKGKPLSEQTKERMSLSHKGKTSGMLGKRHSPGLCRKRSEAYQGTGNPCSGRKWIHKDGVFRMVKPLDLQSFLEEGWSLGGPSTRR